MNVTAYSQAERFVGVKEVPGRVANPAILAMLQLDAEWPQDDEIPWCSAFANYIAWLLRLPRSKSLLARSWLGVGRPLLFSEARPGFDVVVLKRAGPDQPGAEDQTASGHVGFYAGGCYVPAIRNQRFHLLGGNQNDSVSLAVYPWDRVLGVRRLLDETS